MGGRAPDSGNPGAVRPRGRFLRFVTTLLLYGVAALCLAGVLAAVVGFVVYDHVTQPGIEGPEISVEVPQGSTGRDIGRLLVEQGLLEHEVVFRLALQLEGGGQDIRAGVYSLHRGNSAVDLLRALRRGPARQLLEDQFKVTIPEGLTIKQAAELTPDPKGFIEAARNRDLIARLGLDTETLEGFLMPNTYFFDKPPAPAELVGRMVDQFEKDYKKLTAEVPGADKLDKKTVVTIASLVEEETKADEERPLVARVIYNRLAGKMRLQMDSTLQFALDKYGQRLLYDDREVESPYNTYLNEGLPPGPISSPGLASLRAALRPAEGAYLYFVSNADGRTHTFSATEEEHVRAVNRFRQEIAPQRRELREQQRQGGAPAPAGELTPATPEEDTP